MEFWENLLKTHEIRIRITGGFPGAKYLSFFLTYNTCIKITFQNLSCVIFHTQKNKSFSVENPFTIPEFLDFYISIYIAKEEMVKACGIVNERKREQEEAEQQDLKDESDMRLILGVSSTIKLMRMENGLNLLDYGRLRKAGDIVSYTDDGRVGDYAFIFDLMIILCHRPKWLQHRYRFREAIKIRDHFLEPPLQYQHPSSG